LSAFCLGSAAIFLPLYMVLQPTVVPNQGLAAYRAPPGTRVEPLPPPPQSNLQHLTASFALAPERAKDGGREKVAEVKPKPQKPEARARPRKQRVQQRRQYQDPWSAYAQQGGPRQPQQRRDAWSWF